MNGGWPGSALQFDSNQNPEGAPGKPAVGLPGDFPRCPSVPSVVNAFDQRSSAGDFPLRSSASFAVKPFFALSQPNVFHVTDRPIPIF